MDGNGCSIGTHILSYKPFFHMQVFFILAGYTFRPKPWRELLLCC